MRGYNITRGLLLLCVGIGIQPSSRAADAIPADELRVGSDLRDLIRYLPKPEARWAVELLTELSLRTEKYFTSADVVFPPDGVWQSPAEHVDTVFNIELSDAPTFVYSDSAQETRQYRVTAMFHAKKNGLGYAFRKISAKISVPTVDKTQPATIVSIAVDDLIPADKTSFRASIGLGERKIVLTDSNNGITKVYPLGVGGFDEAVANNERKYLLMTPFFQNATLKRATAVFARTDPSYYQAMPFVRIIRGGNEWTPIGLHTNMFSDRLPGSNLENPDVFRGFTSHGCMRMRPKDLYELYYIVMYQGNADGIPINVDAKTQDTLAHPLRQNMKSYETITSFPSQKACTDLDLVPYAELTSAPYACRDKEHNLTVMHTVYGEPPVGKLEGNDGDAMIWDDEDLDLDAFM